jgi:hypothetical protein
MYIAEVIKYVKSNIYVQIIPPSKHPTIPHIRVDKQIFLFKDLKVLLTSYMIPNMLKRKYIII